MSPWCLPRVGNLRLQGHRGIVRANSNNMNKINVLIFSFLITAATFGQSKIYIDKLVDTTDIETKKVVTLWINYLESKPDSLYDNPYWNAKEKTEHKHFDFLENEFDPSLYMGFPVTILNVKNSNGLYQIKSVFATCDSTDQPDILCIANVFAKKENGEYKLFNALPINRDKEWNHRKVGYIDYYFPSYHVFDSAKAAKQNDFMIEACKNFEVPIKQVEYYFADDFNEIERLRGFDYERGLSGKLIPQGKAGDDKVYCAGMGEYYPHELIHVLIDPYYPDCHNWVHEGLATFLGGSRGEDLTWHIKRANDYLLKHPEIDLNHVLELISIDEYTDYRYVIGGLICELVYEKGGWKLLKEFLNTGKTDKDYYNALESFLNVKQKDLNTFLRTELKNRAK